MGKTYKDSSYLKDKTKSKKVKHNKMKPYNRKEKC